MQIHSEIFKAYDIRGLYPAELNENIARLIGRGFAAYLIHGPTYQSLYGAIAVLPVFLLWVYFSCLVTLSAALVAAQLGRTPGPRSRPARSGARARFARARS